MTIDAMRINWKDVEKTFQAHIYPITRKELIPISDSIGRIAGETVYSQMDLPSFTRSLVDGYAIGKENGTKEWKLKGEGKIGKLHEKHHLSPGEAFYTPTGGNVPKGSTCVIKQENMVKNDFLYPKVAVVKDKNIEQKGSDIKTGDIIISEKMKVSVKEVTKLAATGTPSLRVFCKLKVYIIITGNEIIPPGEKLEEGEVFDSTSAMLKGFIEFLGGKVEEIIRVGEGLNDLRIALASAIPHADLIVTTGGTSVGKKDNLANTLASQGEIIFKGINVRPGKPMTFGKVANIPVLGFPGFVTSSLIMSTILLPPVFNILQDQPLDSKVAIETRLGEDIIGFKGWYRLLTGNIKNGKFYKNFSTSSAVSSFTNSSGYVIIPPDCENLLKGTKMKFYEFIC